MTEDQRDTLIAAINETMESRIDYAENHKDAGDSYAHLPCESWSDTDDKNLADFMAQNEIDAMGLEIDAISDLALDNFTMNAGHIFIICIGTMFCCGAFPVSEIEEQLSFADLSESLGFTVTRAEIESLGRDSDYHIGSISDDSVLVYATSDAVWSADIGADELRALVASEAARIAA